MEFIFYEKYSFYLLMKIYNLLLQNKMGPLNLGDLRHQPFS